MTTRNQTRLSRVAVATIILSGSFFVCEKAHAAILLAGGPAVSTPGTFTFAGLTPATLPGGGPADETMSVTGMDTSGNVRYTATVESEVFKEPTGTLDFAYKVTNTTSLPQTDSLHTVSLTSFRLFTTDVDYVSGTGAVTYATAQRLSAGGGIPIVLNYAPTPNNIVPGDSTDWVLVKTNAFFFDNGGTTTLIDGATATVASFEPVVPEPVSLGVLSSIGAALLLGRPNRKARTLA